MTGTWQVDSAQAASKAFMAVAQRMPTLFDLDDQLLALLALLDAPGGIDGSEEFDAKVLLEQVDQAIAHKVEGYVALIRSLDSMASARKDEADRLKNRARIAAEHADWLRSRLLTHMKTMEQPRIETSLFSVSVRQNPPAVVVVEPAMIPHEFNREKIIVEPDKVKIKDHWKTTGELVPGVTIARSERIDIQ